MLLQKLSKNWSRNTRSLPDLWGNPLVLWNFSKTHNHGQLFYSDIFFSNLGPGVLEVIPKSKNPPNTGSYLKPNRLENSWEVRWGEQPSSAEENKTMWPHLIQWSSDPYYKIQHYGEAGEGGKKGLTRGRRRWIYIYCINRWEQTPGSKVDCFAWAASKATRTEKKQKKLVAGRKNHHPLSLHSRRP